MSIMNHAVDATELTVLLAMLLLRQLKGGHILA
jgi:hypothetical protein